MQKVFISVIDLPEVKIKVREREVAITPVGITPERELVANAMLAGMPPRKGWEEFYKL